MSAGAVASGYPAVSSGVTYIGSKIQASRNSAVTPHASTAVGDLLIAFLTVINGFSFVGTTGWTLLDSYVGTRQTTRVYAKIAAGGDSIDGATGETSNSVKSIHTYRGVGAFPTSGEVVVQNSASANSAFTGPSTTPGAPSFMLYGCVSEQNTTTSNVHGFNNPSSPPSIMNTGSTRSALSLNQEEVASGVLCGGLAYSTPDLTAQAWHGWALPLHA